MKNLRYFYLFKDLLFTDFAVLKQVVVDQVINLMIWVICNVLVISYLMPSFGLSESYGSFILAGLCASAGLFGVFPSVVNLISDFEGDRIIDYYLTLPLPSWLVFARAMLYYAINAAIIGSMVLPLGKLLLWNSFDITQVCLYKFLIIFVVTNLFYGAFTLWVASRVRNLIKIGNIWMRFVFPIWFLGGFQFSWHVLFQKWPLLAYLNLLNPMTYIMEGTRAAILGQSGYLPFWLCVVVIMFFSILCAWHSIIRLKKRLDFI